MAKKCYVGVSNKARRVKKIYVGVGNKARRIKKAYVGVGGKARLCYTTELAYWGTASALSTARCRLAGAKVGKYALFAGGASTLGSTNTCWTETIAYNTSSSTLTKSTPTALTTGRYDLAAASVGDYALFAGGWASGGTTARVEAYDTSLSKSVLTNSLSQARGDLAGAMVGDLAIFAGGNAGSTSVSTVDIYTSSLTLLGNVTGLSTSRYYLAAATVGNYAVFAGGRSGTSYSSVVNAYDSSGTRVSTNPTSLTTTRAYLAGATAGNYALFAGGSNNGTSGLTECVSYSASLGKTLRTALSVGRFQLAGASVGGNALFAGGISSYVQSSGYTMSAVVDVYDEGVVHTVMTDLNAARGALAGLSAGDYAIFAGGMTAANTPSAIVDVYTD